MSMSTFIRANREQIMREFAVFARTLMPPGAEMTELELRDHSDELLTAIVTDILTTQTSDEQGHKSQGRGSARAMVVSGRLHADDRIQHGFSFRAVLAEFRALRATVLRLYEASGPSDATDICRFNEAIDEALTESMERFAVRTDLFRDQFIGMLSHDLRSPLGAITVGAALLAGADDNPQRRRRVVASITSSAQRMERMIGDLLDLTRARLGGALPLRRRRVDLRQVCDEALLEIQAGHPEAVVRLDANGDLHGDWDADRLAQVVSNLVGNAVQHGGRTAVAVTLSATAEAVAMTVTNGGTPIRPELMPLVFEPLERGHEEDAGGSIGLGLFIARTIVSAHGGHIEVQSSAEAGTTFSLSLPRAATATARL